MSKPQSRRDVPIGTIAFGASAMRVETRLWRSMRTVINAGTSASHVCVAGFSARTTQ